jgi:hypothetical protein
MGYLSFFSLNRSIVLKEVIMEHHIQSGESQKKHSRRHWRQSSMTVCFLLIFVFSLFYPPFQLSASAASTPSLLTPANGATITATGTGVNARPPVALPEFSWTEVPGTTQYRIQLSRDIGFSSTNDFTTPLTHFIPRNVDQFNDGLWYWRVRVESPVAGNYQSTPNSFTKQWASPDNRPNLTSPADGAVIKFFDQPTFSWQPVIGAASYRLQIASASDFGAIIYDDVVLATTFQPPNKFPNGTRYWRVIPRDAADHEGTSSQVRSFIMGYNEIPELLGPANGSTPTFTPTFRWKAVRGAEYYLLQYSTDPSFHANVTQVNTRNTTYTPVDALPNDVNYYWQVRAFSYASQSDWSLPWSFMKKWTIQPVLLTPTNGFLHIRLPFFSWTPVPGANRYKIEASGNTSFNNPVYIREETSNTFFDPIEYHGDWNTLYWRVTPIDANSNPGKVSSTFSFSSHYTETTPTLVSPMYYYPPNSFPPPFDTVSMQSFSDRTVAWPIFMWNRLTTPPLSGVLSGSTFAATYRVQVSTNALFPPASIVWTVDTQNTHAAPTLANNFTPVPGQDYFWRVRGLNGSGVEIGNWSQAWKAHFSLTNPNDTPTTPPPQLRRPTYGSEIVETTPLFEWWSVSGADSYEVQISEDPSFASPLDSGIVRYPVYSPTTSFAQRSLVKIDYGTYYWRVRARSGGNPLGGWSNAWRFQIASQSERVESRTLGSSSNRLLVATDLADAEDSTQYKLTSLYGMQDSNYWYFGFNVALVAPTDMTYGLYLDLDHKDNSGAASDPRGYTISTIAAHRPEYAIYVNRSGGAFSAGNTEVYAWNGVNWDNLGYLIDLGGDLSYDAASGYVEIKVWNTIIGMSDTTGSYAISLFSLPAGTGQAKDSVPWDPNIPGVGPVGRFVSVSERINTITPQYTVVGDPTSDPFIYPFNWDYPTGSNDTAPWAGNFIKVYTDPDYTQEVPGGFSEEKSDTPYYASTSHAWSYDFLGDNTYYWRIQPCYLFAVTGRVCGVWSQGVRFERRGFVPQNLQESINFATPTFSWGMVEGASRYELQIADDYTKLATSSIVSTAQNSYTPQDAFSPGTYYWRVRVVRYNNAAGNWSAPKTFGLTLPVPTGLAPNDPDPNHAIHTTPTFCWQPLIVSLNGVPVLAASRYFLQVSRGDPTFSSNYEQQETEQSCWTPRIGYDDGTYYWRVAMVDGAGHRGGYSIPAVFTKQYPTAKPLSPVSGSTIDNTPTFRWTAADGVSPYVFGAARYRLEVSLFSTYSTSYEQVDTTNTSYTPTMLYDENKTYYWRVAIIDRNGKLGPFSNATLLINSFPYHIYIPRVIR